MYQVLTNIFTSGAEPQPYTPELERQKAPHVKKTLIICMKLQTNNNIDFFEMLNSIAHYLYIDESVKKHFNFMR